MPLLVDLFAFAAVIVAVVRIIRTGADRWAHGGWSKAGWLFLALWWSWSTRFGVVPVGAMLAIWQTRRLHRQPRPWKDDGLGVPFVEGIAVPFERPVKEAADAGEES